MNLSWNHMNWSDSPNHTRNQTCQRRRSLGERNHTRELGSGVRMPCCDSLEKRTKRPHPDCRHGSRCTRQNCWLAHPSLSGSKDTAGFKASTCHFSINCTVVYYPQSATRRSLPALLCIKRRQIPDRRTDYGSLGKITGLNDWDWSHAQSDRRSRDAGTHNRVRPRICGRCTLKTMMSVLVCVLLHQ